MCVSAESDARVAETEAEYLGESVSNFDMTTFARSRYRDFAESRGSRSTLAPWSAPAHPKLTHMLSAGSVPDCMQDGV